MEVERDVTDIGVELPDKTGEIVVLEELGQKDYGKGLWIPHNEAVVPRAPGNYMVSGRVINNVVCFCEEWWKTSLMKPLNWLRNNHYWLRVIATIKGRTFSKKLFLHSTLRIHVGMYVELKL